MRDCACWFKGLCGTYDGDQTNDFTTDTGNVVTQAPAFVTTWKRSFAGVQTCADLPQTGCNAATPQAVPPAAYISACKEDCCDSSGQDCLCSSFEAYSRACLEHNIRLDWRSDNRCQTCSRSPSYRVAGPGNLSKTFQSLITFGALISLYTLSTPCFRSPPDAQCPGNQIHKECGSMCQKTCQSPSSACEDHSCIDGCFCPDGMVLLNDQCVQKSECPCMLNGVEYRNGEQVPKDTCMNGAWQCTNKRCDATCSAIGDPHYMTFDGKRYDFMGVCSYYMIHDPGTFDIIVDNIKGRVLLHQESQYRHQWTPYQDGPQPPAVRGRRGNYQDSARK
ncbi:MUC6-like protein [Mya arenaria]|uniref:MUC6-like protein n=1 Tax=Mya arenaria TaxID=6604 RepID=A0ABY7EIL0_MYAAR|nr:MUC6-like protein [Mya arenaria]